MPVTSPVSLSKIASEFGGEARASRFVRGGAVPNTAQNQNVSTTANGWRMSTLEGASNISAPSFRQDNPTYSYSGSSASAPFSAAYNLQPTGGNGSYSWSLGAATTTGAARGGSVSMSGNTIRFAGSMSGAPQSSAVSGTIRASVTVTSGGLSYNRTFVVMVNYTRSGSGVSTVIL